MTNENESLIFFSCGRKKNKRKKHKEKDAQVCQRCDAADSARQCSRHATGENSNITSSITEKVGRNLHHVPKHPANDQGHH